MSEHGFLSPNPALFELERLKKRPGLAHELGAGAPCSNCKEKCPGFQLHFWRKVCSNCRCGKAEHNVVEQSDPGFYFVGKIFDRPLRTKEEELHFVYGDVFDDALDNSAATKEIKLDWVPPGVSVDIASKYLKSIPQEYLSIQGSEGAQRRKKQLEKQFPIHDVEPTNCHDLTKTEIETMNSYVETVRQNIAGQGLVLELGVQHGQENLPVLQRGGADGHSALRQGSDGRSYLNGRPFVPAPGTTDFKTRFDAQSMNGGYDADDFPPPPPLPKNLGKLSGKTDGSSSQGGNEFIMAWRDEDEDHYQNLPPPLPNTLPPPLPGSNPPPLTHPKPSSPAGYSSSASTASPTPPPTHGGLRELSERMGRVDLGGDDNRGVSGMFHARPYNPGSSSISGKVTGSTGSSIASSTPSPPKSSPNYQHHTVHHQDDFPSVSAEMFANIGMSAGGGARSGYNVVSPTSSLHSISPLPGTANSDPKHVGSGKSGHLDKSAATGQSGHQSRPGMNGVTSYSPYPASSISSVYPNQPLPGSSQTSAAGYHPSAASGVFQSNQLNHVPSGFSREPLGTLEGKHNGHPGSPGYGGVHGDQFGGLADGQHLNGQQNLQGYSRNNQPELNLDRKQNGGQVHAWKCSGCGESMMPGEVAIFAERAGHDKCWHPACFSCSSCGELLEDLLYFFSKGRLFCGRDFARVMDIPRCSACDELIFASEYTGAEDRFWHLKHFCCYQCDTPLAGHKYIPVDSQPYCLKCWQQSHGKVCSTCESYIHPEDRRVTLGEDHWHASEHCFQCGVCRKSLLGGKMTRKEGVLLCSSACASKLLDMPKKNGMDLQPSRPRTSLKPAHGSNLKTAVSEARNQHIFRNTGLTVDPVGSVPGAQDMQHALYSEVDKQRGRKPPSLEPWQPLQHAPKHMQQRVLQAEHNHQRQWYNGDQDGYQGGQYGDHYGDHGGYQGDRGSGGGYKAGQPPVRNAYADHHHHHTTQPRQEHKLERHVQFASDTSINSGYEDDYVRGRHLKEALLDEEFGSRHSTPYHSRESSYSTIV